MLVGEWILLIRGYGERMSRLTNPGEIEAALTWLDPARDTGLARTVAKRLLEGGQPLRCVWTGAKLTIEALDIDHCLPWSAWPCGKSVFAGKAGTGFGLAAGRELAERLRKIERDTSPFFSVPRAYQRGARWVEPKLVAEVAFTTWTADHLLRHPSFEGLREDKRAREVRLERSSHKGS